MGGGVTYSRSREARLEESGGADFYHRVYDADRPELFFKSVPWRVITHGEPIAIRRDSALNVPEAELAIVVNSAAEIVGYTVSDDVSSRTIEAENPLYLPQAKVYAGACAVAPVIRPAWEISATDLAISMEITRDGAVAWSGAPAPARSSARCRASSTACSPSSASPTASSSPPAPASCPRSPSHCAR